MIVEIFLVLIIVGLITISKWLFNYAKVERVSIDIGTKSNPEAILVQYYSHSILEDMLKHLVQDLVREISQRGQISRPVLLQIKAEIPNKVYAGNSEVITIEFLQRSQIPTVTGETSDQPILEIPQIDDGEEYLELDLNAPGFEIGGKEKQRQPLSLDRLFYSWNCYFPKSGDHSFAIQARLIGSSSNIQVQSYKYIIKVVKLGFLTERQIWVLATLAGILSGGLAILEILKRLGIW